MTTKISGTIKADVTSSNITFVGGSAMVALTNGNWQPGRAGTAGSAPANYGVKLMSMGFLLDDDQPVIWRGPMIMKTIQQFISAVDWGELRLPGGQLVGVFSQSGETTLKQSGFALRDKDFLDKTRYSEWVFRSALPAANPQLAAGAGFSGAATGPLAPTHKPAPPRRLK